MKYEDVLTHFGILGMRWGHRNAELDIPKSSDHNDYSTLKKKPIHSLSTAELKKINERSTALTLYKRNKALEQNKLLVFGKTLLLEIVKANVTAYVKRYANKKFEDLLTNAVK